MDAPKKTRGRPPTPPDQQQIARTIRLTPALWAKIDEHGMEWLRALIAKAKPPK